MENSESNLAAAGLFKEVLSLLKHNMDKAFKAFEKSGITMAQGFLIGYIRKSGKMKINELSHQLNLTNSTVSGIIDRLEKKQIVERVRSNDDKRVVYVSLTPEFAEMHQDFHSIFDKNIENIVKNATPEEIVAVTNGLNILKKLLKNSVN